MHKEFDKLLAAVSDGFEDSIEGIGGRTKSGRSIILLGKQGGDFKVQFEDERNAVCLNRNSLLKLDIEWGTNKFKFSEHNRKRWENFWVRCGKRKDICKKRLMQGGFSKEEAHVFSLLLEAFVVEKD